MSLSVASEVAQNGRRQFCLLLAGLCASPALVWGRSSGNGVAFYSSTGPVLTRYHVDAQTMNLRPGASVTLPAPIQYAWPHPTRRLLYVAYSDRAGSSSGTVHGVATLRIDAHGDLRPLASPLMLRSRPIHITVDPAGEWLLVAFNAPSAVEVYPLDAEGRPGAMVVQPETIDAGVYAHQVRVAPSNAVVLPTRGNDATATTAEEPGAIKVFDFADGQLRNERSIAPNGGRGFGPRHVDFHPQRPWMYVSVERGNGLQAYDLRDGVLADAPMFSTTTLESPGPGRPGQVAGAIHVARDGRHVYLANRADATVEFEGQKVFAGGENSIAVFRIDATTGEPVRIQNASTGSFHVRTFALHPEGRMLVAASVAPMLVREDGQVRNSPAALTVFRIQRDGTLEVVRKIDVDTAAGTQFWCGMVAY